MLNRQRVYLSMVLPYLIGAAVLYNCGLSVFGTREYYVTPTVHNSDDCPGRPCQTFNDYATDVHKYVWTDLVVRFLPGNHNLNQSFHVRNSRNLQFTSFDLPGNSRKPNITCFRRAELIFEDVSNVSIVGLRLFLRAVASVYGDNSGLVFTNTSNIRIDRAECRASSSGNCITIRGTFGKSVITKSQFYSPESTTTAFISVFSNPAEDKVFPINKHLQISESSFRGSRLSAIYVSIDQTDHFFLEISHSLTSGKGFGLWFEARQSRATIHVKHSIVMQHIFGGLQFKFKKMADTNVNIILESTIVSSNIGLGEAGAALAIHMQKVEESHTVEIRNVSFITNKHKAGKRYGSTVSLRGVGNITFSDCKFHNNIGIAICAYQSSVYLKRNNSFIGNSATAGGAIALLEGSQLVILNNSNTLFLSNSASDLGGAIYVHNSFPFDDDYIIVAPDSMCSLFLLSDDLIEYPNDTVSIALNFTNNNGWNGGDAVFGEDMGLCGYQKSSLLSIMLNRSPIEISDLYFDPDENETFSLVSSDPQRVCTCTNGRPNCTIVSMNLSKYPGETFSLPLVVVGTNFGTVTGTVHSNFLHYTETGTAPDLEMLQNFQSVTRRDGCKALSYTVFSDKEHEVMLLTTDPATALSYCSSPSVIRDIDVYLLPLTLCINITLLPCPLGFKLHTTLLRCVCHPQLEKHKITCNISDQTIQHSGSMWINTSFDDNGQIKGFVSHKICPYDYCKHTPLSLNLNFPDEQCAFDRGGILCGGCRNGLSLALGSSHCISCSNSYITFLIPFAIAGVLLVFFLKFLNITVSQGTLSGLIFYANIVKANEAVFFPPGQTNILTIFISWMNLDLGIETCFVRGLNGYWKTWLQFVFPVYMWAITAVIIIASHYSSKAAKIFGNNSVPVLATLFLLSYTKLLRTTIIVLTFTYLEYPNDGTVVVWSYDGNVPYFSLAHALLFIVAVAFLTFLWLPYTGILLFKQILQRYTKYKIMRWMTRLKPFFDAYFGPFKDRHWYWVGTLLLVRVCLLLTFAVVQDPNITLLVISLTASSILLSRTMFGRVYRNWYLSILENMFIQNLTVLSLATLYVRASEGDQETVVYLSVGTAFILFIGIVIWHVLTSKKMKQFVDKLQQKVKRPAIADCDTSGDSNRQPEQSVAPRQPTCTVVALHELREPLLTD